MIPEFTIYPEEGEELDVTSLLKKLHGHPLVLQVSAEQGAVYWSPRAPEYVQVVCWSEEQTQRVQEWTDNGHSLAKFHGSVGILAVSPSRIVVYQAAPAEVVKQIASLLLPLLRGRRWRVLSEGREVTPAYARDPEHLFF
jgi:hypothetical protein